MLWTHGKVEYRLGPKGALTGLLSFHLSKVKWKHLYGLHGT